MSGNSDWVNYCITTRKRNSYPRAAVAFSSYYKAKTVKEIKIYKRNDYTKAENDVIDILGIETTPLGSRMWLRASSTRGPFSCQELASRYITQVYIKTFCVLVTLLIAAPLPRGLYVIDHEISNRLPIQFLQFALEINISKCHKFEIMQSLCHLNSCG